MRTNKSRYWEVIMYPDSAPTNWVEIIEKWYIPVCVSPLHDKDKREDGTLKKPHYHLMLCYGNSTTRKTILELAKELNTEQIDSISSSRGAYDYWTHKNNPEKAQYLEKDMLYLNGFKKEDCITYSDSEIEQLKRAIIDIINKEDISEYKIAYDYLKANDLYECCAILSRNTMFFNAYIKSKKYIDADKIK